MARKKQEYTCPPKTCPAPVDLRLFPELMNRVRKEWQRRMEQARKGGRRPGLRHRRDRKRGSGK